MKKQLEQSKPAGAQKEAEQRHEHLREYLHQKPDGTRLVIQQDSVPVPPVPPVPSAALPTLPTGLPPGQPPISKEKTPYRVVRLLVRHALTKTGKGKRIGEIAERCGLTIGQTRRHLQALIAGRMARQVGRGNGTRYFYREYGPIRSTNPHQLTPGQKAPEVPLTGPGSGRSRRTHPLTDEEREKANAALEEIMDAFKRQSRNRRQ